MDNPNYPGFSGYLDDVDLFDADFFGLTAKKAQVCNPQFRLFLETAWEALEVAGYSGLRSKLVTGVFATLGMSLYSGKNMATYFSCNVAHHADVLICADGCGSNSSRSGLWKFVSMKFDTVAVELLSCLIFGQILRSHLLVFFYITNKFLTDLTAFSYIFNFSMINSLATLYPSDKSHFCLLLVNYV